MNESLNSCTSCGQAVGEPHLDGCSVARCFWSGGQRLSCAGAFADHVRALAAAGREDMADELADYLGIEDRDHDCGRAVWTGIWPGNEDAARLGFFSYFDKGWHQCDKDHPDASPDLNRLAVAAEWDRETQRWEARA